MKVRIADPANRGGHILRAEPCSIRKTNVRPEHELDPARLVANLPRHRQFGFELLCPAVESNKHAAGEIANRLRSLLRRGKRIETPRIRVDTQSQLRRRAERDCETDCDGANQ